MCPYSSDGMLNDCMKSDPSKSFLIFTLAPNKAYSLITCVSDILFNLMRAITHWKWSTIS